MISKLLTAGAMALAITTLAPTAYAGGVDKDGGFYATPIQKGAPRDLPGEQLIPGVNLAVDAIDGIARPLVIDPIQTAGASIGDPLAPAPGPAPAAAVKVGGHRHHAGHHHHHHAGHKHHHHAGHKHHHHG